MKLIFYIILFGLFQFTGWSATAAPASGPSNIFPPALEFYGDADLSLMEKLKTRAKKEPLNLIATIIFLCAIVHTFLASRLLHLAHHWKEVHQKLIRQQNRTAKDKNHEEAIDDVSFKAEVAHFLGEVEAIFGIWVIPLLIAFVIFKDWKSAEHYVNHMVHFTEPLFVVVIMTLAASRPVLRFAEQLMGFVAQLLGGSAAAWWLSILTLGPILGSFITEPAAMTISALLLARKFYDLNPGKAFSYATLGLLFVNISIGGTLTHFAAPPVLMVAGKWDWNMPFMLTHFGWKSVLAILLNNLAYLLIFKGTIKKMKAEPEGQETPSLINRKDPIPVWITVVHLIFLAWTVFTAHSPAFFIGGLLFFLAFTIATEHHQNPVVLKPALLVGFFLAGLVIHGGLQAWWIAPVLGSLGDTPLFLSAILLTAFNDNAAITYLASLVPDLSDSMKYAVVAGAVTGGGLTVIANAPNPAGQSILSKYYSDGVSPLNLLLGALIPTIIAAIIFLVL